MNEKRPEVSEFDSVDPAPPSTVNDVTRLRATLCDEEEKMFQRMRALFALRNIGGYDSVDALAAAFSSSSALLKHEIAYVMGQMQDSAAVPHLIDRLEDYEEDVMVRHEAAEARSPASVARARCQCRANRPPVRRRLPVHLRLPEALRASRARPWPLL